jgi:hypothetical protein
METEMSPQGMRYESALESGSLPQTGQTRQQITTSRARPITREHPRGSLKTARSKTGCQEVPFYGSMENVCLPSLLFRCSNHDVSRLGQRAQGRASSGLSFPINRGRFRELMSTTSSAIIQHIRALCEPEPRKATWRTSTSIFETKRNKCSQSYYFNSLSALSSLGHLLWRNLSPLFNAWQWHAKTPDDDLTKCLRQMLSVLAEHPTYIVMDALDECPDDSGWPKTPREEALDVVRDLVGLPLPNLRICVTSRPEVDIKSVLNPLTIYAVSLHDQSEQKKGIPITSAPS